MAKSKTRYVCSNCGSAQPKWMGKCPDCGEWNSLVETVIQEAAPGRPSGAAIAGGGAGPQALPDIPADGYERIPVPIGELSRVLGGGIVPGSVVLISGDPGIGKSTLLLELCDALARPGQDHSGEGPVLYVSGEESAAQIKLRAERLGIVSRDIQVLAETHLETVSNHIQQLAPRMVVVDSVQSIYSDSIQSGAGSVTQVRGLLGSPAPPGQGPDLSALPGRTRYKGRRDRRPAHPGAHGRHGALPGRRTLPLFPTAAIRQESFWLDQRGRRLRDGRKRAGGGDQPLRSLLGRAYSERTRLGHRRDHGRHPADPGRGAGAVQRNHLRPAPAHGKRRSTSTAFS